MNETWKTLPLVNFGKKNYNNDAGNNAGEPQREGVGKCVDWNKETLIDKLLSLNEQEIKILIYFAKSELNLLENLKRQPECHP